MSGNFSTLCIGPHSGLCAVEFFLCHDTLMGILYSNPICTVDPDHVGMSDHIPCLFPIDILSDIAFIPQNFHNDLVSPKIVLLNAGPACPGAARRPLIEHSRWHSFSVKYFRYLFRFFPIRH